MSRILNADPHGGIALKVMIRWFSTPPLKPSRQASNFAGHYASGVSVGVLIPVKIDTWEIIEGWLAIFYANEVKQKMFEEKPAPS